MTTNAIVAAPITTTVVRRFTQQITALVDEQTRELLLGLALATPDVEAGGRPKEGEQVRFLLDDAIGAFYEADPKRYRAAVLRGRAELARRAEARRRYEDSVTQEA